MIQLYLSQMFETLKALVLLPLVGSIFEMLVPGEKQTIASRIRGLSFNLVYFATSVALATFLSVWLQLLRIPALLPIDLSHITDSKNPIAIVAAYTVVPMLSIVVFDLFYYWYHRTQHVFRPMWRVHSVHHSLEELNLFNSYHHLFEPFLSLVLIGVPMMLLIRVNIADVAIAGFLVKLSDTLIHANAKLSYGPFKYLIAEPRYHRIHHSLERRHWNKNFASYFPFWDVLFGTAYFPKKDEWPKTGLSNQREPRSVREYALMPFSSASF